MLPTTAKNSTMIKSTAINTTIVNSTMLKAILASFPLLLVPAFGCSNDDNDEHDEEFEDVILEGDVTDETMLGLANALEAGDPVDSSSKSPTLDTPADGASIPANSPPTFSWQVGLSAYSARSVPSSIDPSHGDPYSGYATYLEFAVGSEEPVVKVFTSELSFTPASDVWSDIVAAGSTITVTLTGAEFEQDRVIQDGGPYSGSSTQFEVAP